MRSILSAILSHYYSVSFLICFIICCSVLLYSHLPPVLVRRPGLLDSSAKQQQFTSRLSFDLEWPSSRCYLGPVISRCLHPDPLIPVAPGFWNNSRSRKDLLLFVNSDSGTISTSNNTGRRLQGISDRQLAIASSFPSHWCPTFNCDTLPMVLSTSLHHHSSLWLLSFPLRFIAFACAESCPSL